MSHEPTDPPREHAPPDPGPCPACGKSRADWLTVAEARSVVGIGRAACVVCLLTDVRRDKA